MPGTSDELSPLKRALVAVRELKEKVARLEVRQAEPIALVGVGCRFPGARGPESFWELLREGVDATSEVPVDRWDAAAWERSGSDGIRVPRRGAFLDAVDRFDAAFFGISPREAIEMDPVQRLLLEVTWEALEDAGLPPTSLQGTSTALYLGLGLSDYGRRHFLGEDPGRLTPWSGTGSFLSVAAGRIAYTLGLTGPALTIDTACSSSLVATHLAVAALRAGEADVALASGANLLLSPMPTVYFARLQALASDGRCKSFDARADGYGRGEGVGVVVLKRLSDALADGDPIRAVIRGTAVNQDGRSNGLTAPSGVAQQAVIRAALEDAGLSPSDIGLLEAHGTGTPLGDPIEVDALRAVFGEHTPLQLGSVKTNIGHTETAAGVAGLIKAALALQHRSIPPHAHLTEINPRIRLDDVQFSIPTALTAWPDGLPERAGVSGFGLSGTNAHVVLEGPPAASSPASPSTAASPGPELLVLSARSEMALAHLAGRTAERLRARPDLSAAASTAFHGRSALRWRVAVAARSAEEAAERLKDAVRRGADGGHSGWLFTGQGAQWPNMARDLHASNPRFAEVVDRVLDVLDDEVRDVWFSDDPEQAARIGHTRFTQPTLFALQCGLATLAADAGLEPTALVGHSIGEYAAAWFSGVFSLEDGARLVDARGRLMGGLPADEGGMLAVFAPASALPDLVDGLTIAAVNDAGQTVLSGERGAIEAYREVLSERALEFRQLEVSHAFHSPLMDPILEPFREVVAGVSLSPPERRLVSSVDGELLGPRATDPDYWVQQLREPVRFVDALLAMVDCRVFLELGPHPALSGAGRRTLPDARFVPTLRRPPTDALGDGPREWVAALGQAWANGLSLSSEAVVSRTDRSWRLPTMPFQGERFWLDLPPQTGVARSDAVHRVAWVPATHEVPTPLSEHFQGRYIWVFADGPTDVELALVAAGARVTRIVAGTDFEGESDVITVDPGDAAHFQWLAGHAGTPDDVLVLWGLTEPVRSRQGLLAVLNASRVAEAPVSVVVPWERPSGLPGLVRVLRAEHPERVGSLVHVPDAAEAELLLAELAAQTPEVRLSESGREVPRIRRSRFGEPTPLGKTVWITGASGSVGRQLARRLAPLVETLVLLSRRGLPAEELLRLGPHVRGVQGDVTDNLVPLAAEVPPDLVFHLAGARHDAPIDAIDPEALEDALQAKVDGAWRLNEVAPDAELVLVGSAAAALGNPGQGAYAAANAWLEGFARWRTTQGTPTWCVAPGPIADTSMTEGLSKRFARMGAYELGVSESLDLILGARGSSEPVVLLTPFDWARWAREVPGPHLLEVAQSSPTLHPTQIPTQTVEPGAVVSSEGAAIDLESLVARTTAEVLGRATAPDADTGFFDAGMDSLMAAELRARLATALDRSLPASIAFDHPTRRRLVEHLRGMVDAAPDPTIEAGNTGASAASTPDEPIAIVGIGCRFPGGAGNPDLEGPDAFWQFLEAGGDAIRRIDRWDVDALYDPEPAVPGRHYVREAGLLADVTGFDAAAFGIAPREAARLDPQQRLVLEASVRALEHAGIRPDHVHGTTAGVFVGIGKSEYGRRFDPLDVDAEPDPHSGTGNESSFAAGRVSYVLGLQGPAMSVDTACSSSLVTLHLAAVALRQGRCRVALAGGVNAITAPETTVQLSQLRALAPDGRCKTFDARADGYGRGEGVGMLVLQRLSDARAENRPVLAVVRGSAVNHDGASSGLTVPNGSAQRAVLRAALDDAGVDPAEVALLEAHGTGTRLGDPIELDAVRAVYVEGRERAPLVVGSVKTHLGHLEAGAGVAGVLRAVLALRHGRAPAHPDLQQPNPELDLDGIALPVDSVPLEGRFAGVSSFGISGTNAHVVLEVGDPAPEPPVVEARPHTVHVASGATLDAAVAARTVADPRALGEVRWARRFRTFAVDGDWREPSSRIEGRTAWLFTGQGVQWPGMGLALRHEPAFAEAFDRCAAAMRGEGFDLLAALEGSGPRELDHTSCAQPAIFAVEVAIAHWLTSLGFTPDRVVGHSLGEWSAAVTAGVLPLEVAARLVVARGRIMGELPEGGASASVFASEERVRSVLEALPDGFVDVSGLNGPTDTVISGDTDAVEAVLARLSADGVQARRLNVSHAFHSRHMEPAVKPFQEAVTAVAEHFAVPAIPLITNADGRPVGDRALDPAHWARLIREPVHYEACIRTLVEHGVRRFVEVGPHAVLNRMAARLVEAFHPQIEVRFVETQVRPERSPTPSGACTGTAGLYHAAGALWASGLEPDWAVLTGASRAGELPPTPFHRVRHWVDRKTDADAALAGRLFAIDATDTTDVNDVPDAGGDAAVVYRGDSPVDAFASARDAVRDGRTWAAVTREGSGVDGLTRALALSHPTITAGLTLLAANAPADSAAEAPVFAGEAYADGTRRRVVPLQAGPVLAVPRSDSDRATDGANPVVLVTGGTGAVGRAVVRAWQERGASVVVLARGHTSAEGLQAEVRHADVTDAEAVRAALEGLDVRGVVHCAGVGRRVALEDEDPAGFDQAFAARVVGARVLDEVLGDLDFFVLVSSIAAVWGSGDQPAYAAANAALTGVADQRRFEGRPARVVALGPIRGDAQAAGLVDDEGAAWLAARGLTALPASVAANALLRSGPDAVLVQADWSVFAPLMAAGAFGDGLFATVMPNAPAPVGATPGVRRSRSALRDRVRTLAAQVLGLSADDLDPRQGFFDAGMDSLTAVELASRLTADLGEPVPSTLVFEHPTVDAVTDHLLGADEQEEPERPVSAGMSDDPIAIVAMACRFPGGVDSPEAYWALLRDGVDAVTRVPVERWDAERVYDPEPATPGRAYVRDGAFVESVDQFDPLFFGMSPREAAALDPQQRLLLEVSHEALERGGLRGALRRVGVFCGIPESSYLQRFRTADGPLYPDEYAGTGNESSFAAGRVSHALGLEGPAVAFNTACSSSLVAVHLAAEAVRSGDCDAALAGGVSLMLSPDNHIYLSQLRALAPDGRCKTFDSRADGYGRGEGCGMVVLMRRSEAEARKIPVLAELLGSAVNHDGTSSGLTVPNGTAQERVVRDALERSGRHPSEVTYIEAHGTGTKLGDPIEVRAIQRVFTADTAGTDEGPLHLGSVKTQLGHLEQAAGMASLLKVVLQQQHRMLAPHLHLSDVNPAIDLDTARPLRIPTEPTTWEGSRVAGISGFGLSGTNAHLVVGPAETPVTAEDSQVEGAECSVLPTLPIPVAASSPAALDQLMAELDPLVGQHGEAAVARALARRPGLDWRAVRIDGVASPSRRIEPAPRVALLFTGQGAQHPGMAAELLAHAEQHGDDSVFAPFRTGFLEVCGLADAHLPKPLIEAISSEDVHDTRFTQPALFAVEWGLACWWRSLGIEADVVLGHSIGELVAATWSGMLSLADGVHLVCARANAMADLPRDGAMAAVFAPEEVVGPLLVEGAEVAGVNTPDETVISGRTDAIEAVLAALPEGVGSRRLTVSHAFHSALMAPMLESLTAVAATLTWHPPRIPVVSNLDGALLDAPPDPAYWARQVRQAVRFADGVATLEQFGANTCIEVGPHPVLTSQVLRQLSGATAIATLQRKADPVATALEAAGTAWTAGLDVRWDALLGDGPAVRPDRLPTTPFDRVRTWLDLPEFPNLRGPLDDALLELDWEPVDGEHLAGPFWSETPSLAALLEERGLLDAAGTRIHVVDNLHDAADLDALDAALAELLAVAKDTEGGLVVVTRGAPLLDGETAGALNRAVHGFVRAAWAERPDWVVMDVQVEASSFENAVLDGLIAGEPQLAVRPRGVFGARLESVEPASLAGAPDIDAGRAYVVSGGFGGLGLAVAHWLVEAGAGEVVLLSRTPRPERLEGLPDDVVRGVACDVGDAEAVASVIAGLDKPLGGIVHAAGVLSDASLAAQDADALASVARPKVGGAVALVDAAREALQTDAWMAMFSSASAVMGSAGQVPYASANAALDGLAHTWRGEGLNVVSIGWGPWAEVGMAASLDAGIQRTQRSHGIRTIPVSAGIEVLGRVLAAGRPHTLVLPMDWSRYLPVGGSPLLARFGWQPVNAPVATGGSEGSGATVRDAVMAESDDARSEAVTTWLLEVVRDVLRIPDERPIDVGQPLMDLGMDSLMAVQVRNALDEGGFDLPIARLIGGPSIDEIRAMLLATLPQSPEPDEDADGPMRGPVDAEGGASGSIDDWVLRPAVTHVLVALAALILGAGAMWTVLGLTDVPIEVEEDRGPPPRSEQ